MRNRFRSLLGFIATLCALTFAQAAAAQYSAVLKVNDAAITAYEIEQRAALLGALGRPATSSKRPPTA